MTFYGLDIETKGDGPAYGLQPNRVKQGTAFVTAISVVDEHGNGLYSTLMPSKQYLLDMFKSLATIKDAIFIGWNTPFDVSWMCGLGLEHECRKLRWADGMVYKRALSNHPGIPINNEWGLKASVAKEIPEAAGYESEVGGNFDVDDTLLEYNRRDSLYTARLGRIYWERLSPAERVLCNVINSGIIPFAATWEEGLYIDRPWLDVWEQQIAVELDKQFELCGMDAKTLASPLKLKRALIDRGIPVTATNKTELTKWAVTEPLIVAVLAYKKASTAQSKYINNTRLALDYNGGQTVHPSSRLWNTYTGRVGYTSKTLKKYPTGIAIHQWPRGKDARNAIIAPDGFLLAEWDFSTQESRLLADFSLDPVLLDVFQSGRDFHTNMAARIADSDYDSLASAIAAGDKDAKNFRQLAKVVNLALAYRTSWKSLIDVARTDYGVVLTEYEAQSYHALFRNVYVGVPEYWKLSIERAKYAGYAETRGSRKVYINDWARSMSWSSESTAINFPIQGTGADMKFLALGSIDHILKANNARYMLDLHDALFAFVPDSSAGHDLAIRVRGLLSNLPYEQVYGWTPKVPMPVDLKIGKAWGSLKELK